MVFVPASEKGDESDYTSLISITEKLTGFKIETIKVTDYNSAVEAMRAGRAHIAWYGGKLILKLQRLLMLKLLQQVLDLVKKMQVIMLILYVKNNIFKKFKDVEGKVLALNTIGSTSGDLIPQVELAKINLSN